ncbi:MAG: hypothetical protein ACK5ML_01615 [Lachnospiraceae bacterium]
MKKMNTKPIPGILALLAGGVVCVAASIQRYDVNRFTIRFIIVCIAFFFLGIVIKQILDQVINKKGTKAAADDRQDVEL